MAANNPPFLLIRGLIREQRHWGDFVPILQRHFPGTEIITLDVPGNGQLYQEQSPATIADMTEALRGQLTLAQRSMPINLIALSMGGMIALDWMTRYPAEIAAGVLINTSLSNFAPFYQRLRWQNYFSILKMAWLTAVQKEQLILELTTNLQRNKAQILANWQSWQRQYPVSGRNALNQIVASARFKLTQKPWQPLLIITATTDRLVDYRCSERLHEAWKTAIERHLTAGHDVPLDDPQWVSQVIKNWLCQITT